MTSTGQGRLQQRSGWRGRRVAAQHCDAGTTGPWQRLLDGREHAPHALLGRMEDRRGIRVWLPGAQAAWLEPRARSMCQVHPAGLFEWCPATDEDADGSYRIRWRDGHGNEHLADDPYAFSLTLGVQLLEDFSQGREVRAWRLLGAHCMELDGIAGTRFSVWAPNAERVSVVGDFNDWHGLRHPMSVHGSSGVWELFIPGVGPGALYKFELRSRETGGLVTKIDPFARRMERPPLTACIVTAAPGHAWADQDWMDARPGWQHAPMSIYELHPGSWRRHPDGSPLNYRELADALAVELTDLGFTHVELMPVTEHPFAGSWGYQTTGYFAPTARLGEPDDLRYLVDRLHGQGIGVILDWVPGHFPADDHALARFDGSALFEHADPRRGLTVDWDTLVFNFGRNEVRSFLISSALYWLEQFHMDGLRIDAVAAMLYLDYGRGDGDWVPNSHGGNENLEAVAFLQELNRVTHRECPDSFTIAEESTAWPAVTRPVHLGGLGFSMKWNMGWMHDTLVYMGHDPIHRRYHHDALTFGLLYAHSENFVLPLSHDEVVHGKGSLLAKMPGDRWQQFANLRLLYSYMYGYPGKKLLFMGAELAMPWEWSHDHALPETLQQDSLHAGVRLLVADLNRTYRDFPALHVEDFGGHGFEWIDCHDADQSVISFLRRGEGGLMAIICNFTPVPRHDYRLGLPQGGSWHEVLNSDAVVYGGSNQGNMGAVEAESVPWMGRPFSARLTLPPLAAVMLAAPDEQA